MTGDFELPLGRLVMNFGALEWAVIQAIQTLANHDKSHDREELLPDKLSGKVRLLDEMVREQVSSPEILTEQSLLLKEIEALAAIRNNFVHGPWIDVPETNIDAQKAKLEKARFSLSDLGKGLRARSVTPAEVASAGNNVHYVISRFRSHLVNIKAAIGQPK